MMIPSDSMDILCGFHSVFEALRAGRRTFDQVVIAKSRSANRAGDIILLARQKGVQVREMETAMMDKMSDGVRHQGFILKAGKYPLNPADQKVEELGTTTGPCFVLILENIEDPHNMGALIRTALCAGVDSIFIPKDRSVLPSPAVSRSSAGAMEHADLCVMTNTSSLIKQLKTKDIWIGGLDTAGDTPLFKADMTGRFALVVGSEHKGIRPLVQKQCDFLISIPVQGSVNSLNASVAGGIAMYEAFRQRTRLLPPEKH